MSARASVAESRKATKASGSVKKRAIEVRGDIAIVPLTHGFSAIIDAADVPLVERWQWHAKPKGKTVYAARQAMECGKWRAIYLHVALLGKQDGMEIDHADCDGLNNRRSNLRHVTATENKWNTRIRSLNSSGFKGVYQQKGRTKWRARITANGERHSLGVFETREEAWLAYCEASAVLHGEFGRVA